MKRTIADAPYARPLVYLGLLAVAVVGSIVVNRSTQFSPGADADVVVLTTAPIRVALGSNPGLTEVEDNMRQALVAAAAQGVHPDLADELLFIAGDEAYLGALSIRGYEQLQSDAAALAFSNHSVFGDGNEITVISVTIELLPMGWADGINRDHEDGHAYINTNLAELCSRPVVSAEVDSGKIGDDLTQGVIDHLGLLETQAHSQYHVAVSDWVSGSHMPAARSAVAGVVEAGCTAR